MGESTKLTEAIRMIWRDAALVIVKMMREEVAETGSEGVEARASEVEAFANGLFPPFDGKAIREGTGWTDEKVLGVLIDSGSIKTSLLQGMVAKYPGAREALLGQGKRTIWTEEFIDEQERNAKRPGFSVAPDYRVFQAYMLLMSILQTCIIGEESLQSEKPAAGDGAADRQRGRKVKLPKDVFEREVFPVLDKEFPSGGDNAGIKERCRKIGEQYGVSESCIRAKFYDMRYKS